MKMDLSQQDADHSLQLIEVAKQLLASVTPLKTNCGKLCDGACCQSDETCENGMLLFPFEEVQYRQPIPGFPFRLFPDNTLFPGGSRLVCEGTCPREHRPLQCRLFPLRIRIENDPLCVNARAVAALDPRAWAVCPLLEMGGLRTMDPCFIAAVEQAGQLFLKNGCLKMALQSEQALLDEMCKL